MGVCPMKRTFSLILPLLLLGLAAGFLNGLLGACGGIVLIFGMQKLLRDRLSDKRSVFATAIAVILPLSAISALHYFRLGSVDINTLELLIFPAVIGGALGAFLLRRLTPRRLSRIFAAVVLVSGIVMVM